MERLYDIEESAEILRVAAVTVRAWVKQRRLMPVRLGRRVLLTERELERFIDEGLRQGKVRA